MSTILVRNARESTWVAEAGVGPGEYTIEIAGCMFWSPEGRMRRAIKVEKFHTVSIRNCFLSRGNSDGPFIWLKDGHNISIRDCAIECFTEEPGGIGGPTGRDDQLPNHGEYLLGGRIWPLRGHKGGAGSVRKSRNPEQLPMAEGINFGTDFGNFVFADMSKCASSLIDGLTVTFTAGSRARDLRRPLALVRDRSSVEITRVFLHPSARGR